MNKQKMYKNIFIDSEHFIKANEKTKITHIVLDQAANPQLLKYIKNYFDDVKMIQVDRDPRDIFY